MTPDQIKQVRHWVEVALAPLVILGVLTWGSVLWRQYVNSSLIRQNEGRLQRLEEAEGRQTQALGELKEQLTKYTDSHPQGVTNDLSIETAVWFVLYMLGAGLIFGLLMYLINYVASQFPPMEPFAKFAKIGLVILAVLVLIGIIMQIMGHPLIRFG